ncbi:putative nuclease HARBI1, partial [Operophtera brumata]
MTDMQKQEESGQFQNFCRMAPEDFDHLLSLTSEKIRKSSTNFRDSIPAYDKLAVTLRFLATGDSYESLMYFTKMSKSTICNAISKVCAAINEALQDYAKRHDFQKLDSCPLSLNHVYLLKYCLGLLLGRALGAMFIRTEHSAEGTVSPLYS